jgi:RimJ/RimL family protein N-acetyltransferase
MLLGINEPGQLENDQAPILYICWAPTALLIQHRAGLPEPWLSELRKQLNRLSLDDKLQFGTIETILQVAALTLGSRSRIEHGPAFYIPKTEDRRTDVAEITAANRDCLQLHFSYTAANLEFLQPCMAKIVDGTAVAICRTVRRTAFALECGVHTLEEYRNRGFGLELVHAWAKSVQAAGLIPCYSTQHDNKASLALAARLGSVRYATDIALIPE